MSTAIAEPEATTEQDPAELVAQRPAVVNFFSRRAKLYLVRDARYPMRDQTSGRKLGETKGVAVQFKNHMLSVPLNGMMQLANGGHKVPGREILDWLIGNEEQEIPAHHLYEDRFEGFWCEAQLAPVPTQPELDRLTIAAVDGNLELLEEIIEEERAQWNRPDFISLAERARDRINEHLVAIEAAREAERARAEADATVQAQAERAAAKQKEKPATRRRGAQAAAEEEPQAAEEPQEAPQGPEDPDAAEAPGDDVTAAAVTEPEKE